jgi:phosphoadenosine phosphosulfate reductase
MKIKHKRPFLGALLLAWCDTCNVPIAMGAHCGRCGNKTRPVAVAPPGDARPAFEGDLNRLIASIAEQYGEEAAHLLVPSDKVVLLNAIPDLDCCEEVIVDGQIIGLHRFRLDHLDWEFIPKLEGARRLAQVTERKRVVVDNSAVEFIVRGANVMGPGIKEASAEIEPGDSVFVADEQGLVLCTGSAAVTGNDMRKRTRGVAVRRRYWGPPEQQRILPGGQDWRMVQEANETTMQGLERKAIGFIRATITEHNRPVLVAFSGGKDSLAVLLLALKACPADKFQVMFIDTGIEFPETIDNVYDTISNLGLTSRLLVKKVDKDQFFRVLDQYGLVARDYRVCCKTLKLGPTTQLIEEHFPDGCLSFIGQRRYESRRRSTSGRIWQNPWVPNQIGAGPIHDWTALMVWLYLFREQAPFNQLYRCGFERIGCMFCPASNMSELDSIAARYPTEWNRWYQAAQTIAQRQGLSKDWLKHGFWRWKNHPPKIQELAQQLQIPLKTSDAEVPQGELSYTVSEPRRTSRTDGTTRGQFTQPIALDQAIAFLPAFGTVLHDSERGLLQIMATTRKGAYVCLLFESGDFTVTGPNLMLGKTAEALVKVALRGILCTGCGTCQTLCPQKAISLRAGRATVDAAACTRCGACLRGKCPTLYAVQHRLRSE